MQKRMLHYHCGLPCFSVQSALKPVYFVILVILKVNCQSLILYNDCTFSAVSQLPYFYAGY